MASAAGPFVLTGESIAQVRAALARAGVADFDVGAALACVGTAFTCVRAAFARVNAAPARVGAAHFDVGAAAARVNAVHLDVNAAFARVSAADFEANAVPARANAAYSRVCVGAGVITGGAGSVRDSQVRGTVVPAAWGCRGPGRTALESGAEKEPAGGIEV